MHQNLPEKLIKSIFPIESQLASCKESAKNEPLMKKNYTLTDLNFGQLPSRFANFWTNQNLT